MSFETDLAFMMNDADATRAIAEWRANRDQWINRARKLEAEVTDLMDKLTAVASDEASIDWQDRPLKGFR